MTDDSGHGMITGERPSCPRRVGEAQAMAKSEACQPSFQIDEHRLLPTEQVSAAASVDPKPVIVGFLVKAGGWAVAHAPIRELFKSDAIGLGIDSLPTSDTFFVDGGGVRIQTFNPQTLGDSEVITMGIELSAGNGNKPSDIRAKYDLP